MKTTIIIIWIENAKNANWFLISIFASKCILLGIFSLRFLYLYSLLIYLSIPKDLLFTHTNTHTHTQSNRHITLLYCLLLVFLVFLLFFLTHTHTHINNTQFVPLFSWKQKKKIRLSIKWSKTTTTTTTIKKQTRNDVIERKWGFFLY